MQRELPPLPDNPALIQRVFRLILELSRRGGAESLDPDWARDLAREEFLPVFHGLAMRHGVLGLTLSGLQRSPVLPHLEGADARRVLAPLRLLTHQALLWNLERDRLLQVMERGALTPLLLKGGALREYAYSYPVERPIGDLDLLLPSGQIDAAVAAMQAAGYGLQGSEAVIQGLIKHHFHLGMTSPNGFAVELHWGLTPPAGPFRLDPAGLFARAESIPAGGRIAAVPSPEDMLLHLAHQNTEDDFSRIRRLVDMDRVIATKPPNWPALDRGAKEAGLEIVLALSLRLAHLLLGTPIPAGFIDRLGVSRLTRAHLRMLQPLAGLESGRGPRRVAGAMALAFWIIPGPRRLGYLRQMITGRLAALDWLWQEEQPPSRQAGSLPGVGQVLKLMGYHPYLWLVGAATALASLGRMPVDLWATDSGAKA